MMNNLTLLRKTDFLGKDNFIDDDYTENYKKTYSESLLTVKIKNNWWRSSYSNRKYQNQCYSKIFNKIPENDVKIFDLNKSISGRPCQNFEDPNQEVVYIKREDWSIEFGDYIVFEDEFNSSYQKQVDKAIKSFKKTAVFFVIMALLSYFLISQISILDY